MAHNPSGERIAGQVRAAMARADVTQADLARELHISQAAVSRRLSGRVDFTIGELLTVACVVAVPLTDLIEPVAS